MIRALFTLLKISLVVAAVVWVVHNPGTIEIDWLGAKATFHIGAFLFALLIFNTLGIVVFSFIKTTIDWPKNMQRYKSITGKEKGLKALTLGLSAVAAGDAKSAHYQATRAKKFLGDEHALSYLLEAQSARLKGNELDASQAFMALLEQKESSFLGVRGLLQSALDHGDYKSALELGYRALEDYPKQGWILSVVYDLEIRLRQWDNALKMLYRAEKAGAITKEKANSDRVAMLLAQAEQAKQDQHEKNLFRYLQKAYKTDSTFIPAVVRLGRMYVERKKYKAAASIIEKAWKRQPHPALADIWGEAYQSKEGSDPMDRVRWFEKLLAFNPQSVEGLQALARVLIEEGLWGEARKYLQQAEETRPNVVLYKLWARLEERATHDDLAVKEWLEKAADAARERVWICSETGRVYDEWQPISDQELFNTIIWDFPQGRDIQAMLNDARSQVMRMPLLSTPKDS